MPRFYYVFLDEGGDLNFSPSGSRYFSFTTAAMSRPFAIEGALSSLRYDLIEFGLPLEYFHAAEDRQAVRDQVFSIIRENLTQIRLDALIVEKSKTGPALRADEAFYPRMLGYLLKYIFPALQSGEYDEVVVITDSIPINRKREAIEKAVKQVLAGMLPAGMRYQVLHHASKFSFGLQVADYCNWAIFRKWERNDRRSYDPIKPAIRSEFDIFQRGATYYYKK